MRVLKGQKVSILGTVGASDRHHNQVTEIATADDQLGGFIDVKMPTKGRRTLGSWRAWKRQWCTVGRSTGGGDNKSLLQLTLSSNNLHSNSTIQLPHCATLCRADSRSRPYAFGIFSRSEGAANHRPILFLSGRSEPESQLWMARIRTLLAPNILPVLGDEFTVSLIENKYSRRCGLCGVYGVLSLDETEMSIRDPSTSKVLAVWKWSNIEHNYLLDPTHNDEDAGKIFVFHLRKCEDQEGGGDDDGELRLFCWDAEELQSAVSQYRLGRQHRLLTAPLPPTPTSNYLRHLHWSRRLSRSEGDLRWPIPLLHRLHSSQSPSPSPARRNWSNTSRERNSNSLSSEKETRPLGKVARSLILASASFGLLLSTPGSSEPDSLHEYQSLDYLNNTDQDKNSCTDLEGTSNNDRDNLSPLQSNENFNDDEDGGDILGELHSNEYFKNFTSTSDIMAARRVSGASVASGIYAEIDESVADMTIVSDCLKFYENLKDSSAATTRRDICSRSSSPPPLPPRRRNESINGYREYIEPYLTTGGAESLLHTHHTDNKDEKTNCQEEVKQKTFIEKNYVSITNENNLLFTNRKDLNETRDFQSSSPPSVPPRHTPDDCNIQNIKEVGSNSGGKEEETNAIERVTMKSRPTSRCGDEPDYLPMSQITYHNNDTYVVMANIIHSNKMSEIAVTESAP